MYRWRRFASRSHDLQQVGHWLAGLLPAGPASDEAVSIAVELAANAVRQTATGRGGHFIVEVNSRDHPGVLRISVTGDGASCGPSRPTWAEVPWTDGPAPRD